MLRHGAPLKLWWETGVPLELQQGTWGSSRVALQDRGFLWGCSGATSRVVLGQPFSGSDVRVATHWLWHGTPLSLWCGGSFLVVVC